MYSVGLLYSSRDFLRLNKETEISSDEFLKYFKTFKYSTSERILDVSFKCGWVKVNQDEKVLLTDRGKEISNQDYQTALLLQLEDLILSFNPSWASVLPKGRTEAKNFLPSDVLQCFKEAGLFDELNDELIKFWDKLSLAYRNHSQKRMNEIGRIGEKLSFEYEVQRTKNKPIWQAVESNIAGYDLLSIKEMGNTQKLQIEVKSSTSNIEYAELHLSKHEWNTAMSSLNYIFHIWLLYDKPILNIISVDIMSKHIPIDIGDGNWESVEIPFKVLILK